MSLGAQIITSVGTTRMRYLCNTRDGSGISYQGSFIKIGRPTTHTVLDAYLWLRSEIYEVDLSICIRSCPVKKIWIGQVKLDDALNSEGQIEMKNKFAKPQHSTDQRFKTLKVPSQNAIAYPKPLTFRMDGWTSSDSGANKLFRDCRCVFLRGVNVTHWSLRLLLFRSVFFGPSR